MVAVSWSEGDSKMNSEGMLSSAGGQFGSGTLGGTGMVSNLVINSTEIKPPYFLLVQKNLSPKLLRNSLERRMMIIGRRSRFRPLKMECPGALQELTS